MLRQTLQQLPFEPDLVLLPPGEFLMGTSASNDSETSPQHHVEIRHGFAVGKHPVTFDQWDVYLRDIDKDRDRDQWGRGNRPVILVHWFDVQDYIHWLRKKTGRDYRLLTEAEWEYACRAGSQTRWSFGDDETLLSEYAWHFDNSEGKTHGVAEKLPNAWGLFDMHGNVWEWVADAWHDNYRGAPADGSAWMASKWWASRDTTGRVLRGGSWRSKPRLTRSTARLRGEALTDRREFNREDIVGFRLALDLP